MADGDQTNQNTSGEQQQDEKVPAWVKDLKDSFQGLGTGINTLVELAKESRSTRQQPQPQTTEEDDEQPDGSDLLDEQQLELMPRSAFARRLMDSFSRTLEGKLEPLVTRIQEQGQTILTNHYVTEAEKFASKTKDFADWSEEMQEIAKDNPNLPISRIYAIARSENPTKAAEMAEKYKDKTQQEKSKLQGRKAPLSLSTTGAGGDVKNTRMNAEDAAKSAWEESVAKFGNVFSE